MGTKISWNALKAVLPSDLYSCAGIPSAPGFLPLFISPMAVLTSSTLGGKAFEQRLLRYLLLCFLVDL